MCFIGVGDNLLLLSDTFFFSLSLSVFSSRSFFKGKEKVNFIFISFDHLLLMSIEERSPMWYNRRIKRYYIRQMVTTELTLTMSTYVTHFLLSHTLRAHANGYGKAAFLTMELKAREKG